MVTLSWIVLALAILPLSIGLVNLLLYRTPRRIGELDFPKISVLIPARNEAEKIEEAVRAACTWIEYSRYEVIVLDDHSTDQTAAIVTRLAAILPQLRLIAAPDLPPGWSGKQHACFALSRAARHELLLFVDADVRLEADALPRLTGFMAASRAALASGIPYQETHTWLERMFIPLIHFLMLGYLPIVLMRLFTAPALGAGCGQLMIVRADAYQDIGGHQSIRNSLHDGLTLPRAFRRHGYFTTLFDATSLASCRMYDGGAALWEGFAKNATEGMAKPLALPIWSFMLLGGHIVPWILLILAGLTDDQHFILPVAFACLGSVGFRLILAFRFRQSKLAALTHPFAISGMLMLQIQALWRAQHGRPVSWRGRSYSAIP